MKIEVIVNCCHSLFLSEYWMRQRLFYTFCDKNEGVVPSDRFTSSILNLLCEVGGRGDGLQILSRKETLKLNEIQRNMW